MADRGSKPVPSVSSTSTPLFLAKGVKNASFCAFWNAPPYDATTTRPSPSASEPPPQALGKASSISVDNRAINFRIFKDIGQSSSGFVLAGLVDERGDVSVSPGKGVAASWGQESHTRSPCLSDRE